MDKMAGTSINCVKVWLHTSLDLKHDDRPFTAIAESKSIPIVLCDVIKPRWGAKKKIDFEAGGPLNK